MPRFRALKSAIRPWLRSSDWTPEQPLPPLSIRCSPLCPKEER